VNDKQSPSTEGSGTKSAADRNAALHKLLTDLVARAKRGDETALPQLRNFLDHNPILWEESGDLGLQVELSLMALVAGSDLHRRECLTRKAAEMKKELAGPSPTPLERLAVARVVACWLQTAYFDGLVVHNQQADPVRIKVLVQQQESASRRYLAAMGTLATLRKLLPARPVRPMVPDAARFTGGQNDAEVLAKGTAVLN
jgi:hypothetical protein